MYIYILSHSVSDKKEVMLLHNRWFSNLRFLMIINKIKETKEYKKSFDKLKTAAKILVKNHGFILREEYDYNFDFISDVFGKMILYYLRDYKRGIEDMNMGKKNKAVFKEYENAKRFIFSDDFGGLKKWEDIGLPISSNYVRRIANNENISSGQIDKMII